MTTNRTRQCYDTTLIYLFITGNEHLLPAELLNKIPYSTRSSWKNYVKDKFVGHTQQRILETGIKHEKLFQKYKHIKRVLQAVTAIYIAMTTTLDLIKTPLYQVKENKILILNIIAKHKDLVGLIILLNIFKLSLATYQNWLLDLKVKCSASYFEQCTRRYGTQLLKPQVELIKNALTCTDYTHWPIASIAYYFQRTNVLHASVNTWYKYARLLGIKRKRKRRAKTYEPIPCTKPNQYWHVDITYVTTKDNIKHCIYFLSDNFSRKILAWRLTSTVSWTYVKQCIEDAYNTATERQNHLTLNIVSDGGPENTHHSLQQYIDNLDGNIKKLIALKDITFSNSPAETKNRTFKSYYSPHDCENENQLRKKIEFYVTDVNTIKPSCVLKGYTPHEVYTNTKPDFDFAKLRKIDANNRKQINKNNPCNECHILKSIKE